jgi:hypothetical protein
MKYPPEIKPGEFQDVEKEDYTGKLDSSMSWELDLGSLATYKISGGVQARLNNLGFATTTSLADGVKAYQRHQNRIKKQANPVTGTWTDIQADIKTAHDDP